MKNYKGNMLLIELVIVLLFFSLSQVVIVQLFATAQNRSAESRATHEALVMAESVSEQLAVETDREQSLLSLGFEAQGDGYVLRMTNDVALTISLASEQASGGELQSAQLTATRGEETLFAWPITRYQPKEGTP